MCILKYRTSTSKLYASAVIKYFFPLAVAQLPANDHTLCDVIIIKQRHEIRESFESHINAKAVPSHWM